MALLSEALEEPNYQDLGMYRDAIVALRQKGFSFREIASWLSARDVDADHNAVYRIYTKGLSDDEQFELDRQEEEEAEAEAHRNP